MLLSKEVFKVVLKEMQTMYKQQHTFCSCLEDMVGSSPQDAFIYSQALDTILSLLETMFDDKDDIFNFLFELEAIYSDTLTPVRAATKNGKMIYSNVDELYDYLVSKYG